MLEGVLVVYAMLCLTCMLAVVCILLGAEKPSDNLTWARVLLALVLLPGTIAAVVFIGLGWLGTVIFTALDKPIRR